MPTPPIPGEPHPDVAIVKAALKEECKPGQVVPYRKIAAAIQLTPNDPTFRQRSITARRQLRREGLSIVCVRGEGFMLETGLQTIERFDGRERRGMHRKARKNGQELATVNAKELAPEKQVEFFAARTINNVVYLATGARAAQKMISAATVASAELPMAKALAVLATNGQGAKDE